MTQRGTLEIDRLVLFIGEFINTVIVIMIT